MVADIFRFVVQSPRHAAQGPNSPRDRQVKRDVRHHPKVVMMSELPDMVEAFRLATGTCAVPPPGHRRSPRHFLGAGALVFIKDR